jgi:hypothetical protein
MRKTLRKSEGLPMMGTISMVIRDAHTRKVRKRITIRNKITYLAADILVELIAQRATDPAPGFGQIYSMRMGSSNTAAARSDTNLGAFVIGKVIGDVGKVTGAPGEIKFIATLDTGDANGSTLREAGLFTSGDPGISVGAPSASNTPGVAAGATRLFARQVYPDIPKTPAIVVDYSWTIAFTAVP